MGTAQKTDNRPDANEEAFSEESVSMSSHFKKVLTTLAAMAIAYMAFVVLVGWIDNNWTDEKELAGTLIPIENSPLNLRNKASLVALEEGKVFIWGGSSTSNDSGAIYDSKNNSWEEVPAAPGSRGRYDAAYTWTGEEVFIWGGHTSGSFDFNPGGMMYNPATGEWRELPDAPYGMMAARAVAFEKGILIAGGNGQTAQDGSLPHLWFDLDTESWSEIEAGFVAVSTIEFDGRILATGPQGSSDWAVFEFDLATKTWERLTGLVSAGWAGVAPSQSGDLTLMVVEAGEELLRGYQWKGGAWSEVVSNQTYAGLVNARSDIYNPPHSAWTGKELLTGGQQGLVTWNPDTLTFAAFSDRDIRSFGADAVWTGDSLVSLSSQGDHGFVWTPGK